MIISKQKTNARQLTYTIFRKKKDITDLVTMIMINCYIAIAFVEYFSYQNNTQIVSNEASRSTI